jgi:cellobiose-specific phosphotransferase system component IIA
MVLVQRVYNTIDGELTKLEKQKGASSQDRERASRALSQMVSSLEKAVEMQREMTKAAAKGSGVKDKEALAHAEDLRRAIAERLERLQRQRALGKRSE